MLTLVSSLLLDAAANRERFMSMDINKKSTEHAMEATAMPWRLLDIIARAAPSATRERLVNRPTLRAVVWKMTVSWKHAVVLQRSDLGVDDFCIYIYQRKKPAPRRHGAHRVRRIGSLFYVVL